MGCDLAQGFIIGRATSLRNVLKRLKVERGRDDEPRGQW